ncbi:MAG TPA: uroporphyrinogen-III C-methyltransferase [Gammaproteobacteria bacterium]|jgi:uroporphyrin-3 C-methyltransferase
MNATPERREPARAAAPRSGVMGSLGLLLGIAALALAAVSWVRLRALESSDAQLQQRFNTLQANAALKDDLASDASDTQTSLKALDARTSDLENSFNELRQHSQEGRDAWIKAEAASLLLDADEALVLRADPDLALTALDQADGRLKLLPDPRLIPVRQEIARESNKLRALPHPDVEGMAVKLTELGASVDALPMKRTAPEHYQPGGDLNDVTLPADADFWARLKAAMQRLGATLFTLRRHNAAVEPLLAPDEEFMLRRNLELKLENARSALLQREDPAFQAAARSADTWLQEYFDPTDNGVKSAIQQLDDMQKLSIAPKLPDISGSLTLLRQVETPKGGAP